MLQMKKQFADSFEELKNLRTIVVTALLIAIAVVLGFFSVQLTENLKIGFSFIANEYVLAFDVVWKCIYGNFTATSDQTDHHGADTVDHVVCGC